MPGTRKLGRPTAHRKAMLRGMVTLLLENGQVETTLTRAKEVRSIAEKMITLGKKNTLASRRAALAYITKEAVVTKVFVELAPLYAERNGGYTQIFKLGPRRGDGAEMAIVKLIDYVKNGGTLYLSGSSDSRLIKEFFGGNVKHRSAGNVESSDTFY